MRVVGMVLCEWLWSGAEGKEEGPFGALSKILMIRERIQLKMTMKVNLSLMFDDNREFRCP